LFDSIDDGQSDGMDTSRMIGIGQSNLKHFPKLTRNVIIGYLLSFAMQLPELRLLP